tara:strand:+ start:124 stop:303 length:180 start_codon:yes stop_codon:yes gene_type:complete
MIKKYKYKIKVVRNDNDNDSFTQIIQHKLDFPHQRQVKATFRGFKGFLVAGQIVDVKDG